MAEKLFMLFLWAIEKTAYVIARYCVAPALFWFSVLPKLAWARARRLDHSYQLHDAHRRGERRRG